MAFNDIKDIDKVIFTVVLTLFLSIFILSIVNKFKDNRADLQDLEYDINRSKLQGYKKLDDYLSYKNNVVNIVKNYERNKNGDSLKKLSNSLMKHTIRGVFIGACFARTLSGTLLHAILTGIIVTVIDYNHLLT